jgi:hypothetical protein
VTSTPLSPEDQAGLDMHVRVTEPQDPDVISLFWALVRDARQAARRDLDTGAPRDAPQDRPEGGIWSASLMYMVLCDQIGTAFEPLDADALPPETPGFRRSLIHFGRRLQTLSEQDLDTLWALRCSFAHDYSLINRPERPNPRARFSRLFALTWSTGPPLVQDPPTLWDGDMTRLPPGRSFVNLRAFEELVEGMVVEVQQLCRDHKLVLAGEMDARMFTARYSMRIPKT